MKVTVLVGGVGGAKFLQGARERFGSTPFPEATGDPGEHSVTAVVNVGDDAWMHGVRICPDLDTCMYTLGGGIDPERGWGRAGETWHAKEELAAYGADPDWFGLGDRDLATHLIRTQMLAAGYPLTEVTAALCNRWRPGVRLLPASDTRHETHVVIADDDGDRAGDAAGDGIRKRAIHFEEWWVRYRADVPTFGFAQVGSGPDGTGRAEATPAVLSAIEEADVVFLAPSNPIVSVGAVLSVGGIRGALRRTSAKVVGVSPVIGGAPLRGMADRCLDVVGLETSAQAIGAHFGARSGNGLLDGWLVAEEDADTAVDGVPVAAVPLLMTTPTHTAAMIDAGLELVGLA
ncbi:2-phospho-L-lactate transferase [Tsukamurella sp. 8F]|uniref:2-phospho-L-lactate transferase n=1 Tax=unclassified Tsukamurella TaxID=2633480 RepID=UPI0023B909ED|nr:MULTISPECIES: 2-phospho-L-lactate transferase [unclassified Tsukamurella]MDF0530380.1 2-phospho-L-lactate transferase [Tsukamurella sp. 8J]MDF0587677.1 2-phospho-L-lactate transferase [Tsukamurella sp. 8F]